MLLPVQKEVRNSVTAVDSPEATLEKPIVRGYAALQCEKYKYYLPQIGKLSSMDEATVTVDWLHGSYTDVWIEWKARGKTISERFP